MQGELCLNLNAVARDLVKLAEAANSPAERDKANGLARATTRVSTELIQVTHPDPIDDQGVQLLSLVSHAPQPERSAVQRPDQNPALDRPSDASDALRQHAAYHSGQRDPRHRRRLYGYLKSRLGLGDAEIAERGGNRRAPARRGHRGLAFRL